MTSLPATPPAKKLGLVIDLDTCVGCHACAVACKEWNTGGYPAPLTDQDPYGAGATGSWLNRIHSYELEAEIGPAGVGKVAPGEVASGEVASGEVASGEVGRTVYFPRSCLHCDNAPCVTVCPTGASFKRAEDGIVLVDEDKCFGCGLCAWACPYGARELDQGTGTMKKCTLCVDRITDQNLDPADRVPACVQACPASARHYGDLADPDSEVSRLVAARGGYDLMPEMDCAPTNKYLPPRPRRSGTPGQGEAPRLEPLAEAGGFLGWLDRVLAD